MTTQDQAPGPHTDWIARVVASAARSPLLRFLVRAGRPADAMAARRVPARRSARRPIRHCPFCRIYIVRRLKVGFSLVTVTGPGGMGKTRLAGELARGGGGPVRGRRVAGRGAEATIGRWFMSEASPAMAGRAIALFQSSSLLIPPGSFTRVR